MNKELRELIGLTKVYIKELQTSGVSDITVDDSPEGKKTLAQFFSEIKDCRRCGLAKTRTNLVFGEGNPNAELVFIGEAPGYEEDRQGHPFVGRAGQLLNKILKAMHMARSDIYICNVLKCRPPGNRSPLPEEVAACRPHLEEQLRLLTGKKVICCLGLHAAKCVLGLDLPLRELRKNWYQHSDTPVRVTYHPAYLLRNPHDKGKVWNDMKKVMECLPK